MNNIQQRLNLIGGMLRWGEDFPGKSIPKQEVLIFADHDVETAEAALIDLEHSGAIQCLADLRTAAPDTAVARIHLQQMYAFYAMLKTETL